MERKIISGKQVRLSDGHIRMLLIIGEPLPLESSVQGAQPAKRPAIQNRQDAKRTLHLDPPGTVDAATGKIPK